MTFCEDCFGKQRKIDELEKQVVLLKSKLKYQEWTAKEGLFGSSTPSSKPPAKANTADQLKQLRGGGKPGHKGHGRRCISQQEADRVEMRTSVMSRKN